MFKKIIILDVEKIYTIGNNTMYIYFVDYENTKDIVMV